MKQTGGYACFMRVGNNKMFGQKPFKMTPQVIVIKIENAIAVEIKLN